MPSESTRSRLLNAAIRVFAAKGHRNFDSGPAGAFNRIMLHPGTGEAAPDELILSEVGRLEGDKLGTILGRLLGTRSKSIIAQTKLNVIGLCVFSGIAHLLRRHSFPEEVTPARICGFIDRQHAFALAGLAALAPVSV